MRDKIEIEVNCFEIQKNGDILFMQGIGNVKIDGENVSSHTLSAHYQEDKKYRITIEELKND